MPRADLPTETASPRQPKKENSGDQTGADRQSPANAIVILLDSLNRHMVGAYGGTEFATPNLDRFAQRAIRFDSNFAGSLPCIPARHDLLCGALDFLWKPWGSIEIWENSLPWHLKQTGIVSQLVSDHECLLYSWWRELPHRLHRLAIRARWPSRSLEDSARSGLDRRHVVRPRAYALQ